jgi:hypothetical protein
MFPNSSDDSDSVIELSLRLAKAASGTLVTKNKPLSGLL